MPRRLICASFAGGTAVAFAYALISSILAVRRVSLSPILAAVPRISERSTVVTLMPERSRIFSE
jgi:hypothetical protein